MKLISLIDGEKGGVGKSFFARVLVQYYIDNQIPYALIDADGSNPDVAEIYPDCAEKILFSELNNKAHEADKIFELAIDDKKPIEAVIVNLPANIYNIVNLWLKRNHLLELSKDYKVKFYKWFICGGGFNSIELFKQSVIYHKNKLPHVFVKNMGLTDDWKFLDDDLDFQKFLLDYQQSIVTIEFPKCDYDERFMLAKKKISFKQAISDETFTVLARRRIQYFLQDSYDQINEILTAPDWLILSQNQSKKKEPTEKILIQEEVEQQDPVESF